MNRRRETRRTLTGSRIYAKSGKYFYFSPEPVTNPKTNKVAKWHMLCSIDDGEMKAREVFTAMFGPQASDGASKKGNLGIWLGKWKTAILKKRQKQEPKDPVRLKIWETGTKSLLSQLGVIERGFEDFDVGEVGPVDVATFLDQWEGRRSAQSYRGHLSKFFAWCCRKGLRDTNPAREVEVEKPPQRDVYMPDEVYLAIQKGALTGKDKKPTQSGPMLCIYMDLLYLFYQRGTEIRLMRWDQDMDSAIDFKPTKTERSSGAKVQVPIGPDARVTLDRAKAMRKMRSMYVIHNRHGQPYSAKGMSDLFDAACERAAVTGFTLKDIRAKAATDAKKRGYTREQIKTALAHGDVSMTDTYIRARETPVSEVIMSLPTPKE